MRAISTAIVNPAITTTHATPTTYAAPRLPTIVSATTTTSAATTSATTTVTSAPTTVTPTATETDSVPLKMRVKILKFLTKNGDAAHKKDAMRQLMAMATGVKK